MNRESPGPFKDFLLRHCQYSWVSQQGNPREMQGKSSVGFQQGNSDAWISAFHVKEIHRRFSCLGKAAVLRICYCSWGRKSNNSGSESVLWQEVGQFWGISPSTVGNSRDFRSKVAHFSVQNIF